MSFWTDWSDGKKWIMGIMGALIVGALVAGVNEVMKNDNAAGRKPGSINGKNTVVDNKQETMHLPEEQARAQIGVALGKGEIYRAIAILRGFPAGEAKAEECYRVFLFCIKNPRLENALDGASVIANVCWNDEKRQLALQEIAMARLKE